MNQIELSSDIYRLLPHMIASMEDSIYIMAVNGSEFTYAYLNLSASIASGLAMSVVGQTLQEATTPNMAAYLYTKYSKVLRERKSVRYEDGYVMPNGSISGESILTPIFNSDGVITHVICITRDTTERKQYEELLRYYAYHDELTQFYNRRYLYEHLYEPAVIFLLDLDHFKHVNDTLGHDVGDLLIAEVAARLSGRFGTSYSLVRLGGDEFILASLQEETNPEAAAEQIIETFDKPFELSGKQMQISVSIGIAVNANKENIFTLLKQADRALYHSKGEGRNQYHVYSTITEMNESV